MFFYMPTKVYEEINCVEKHRTEICSLGTKALIVTGKHSSKKNGSLADMEVVLKHGNVSYQIFDDIEENPSVETVIKAAKMADDFGADFVVGIGGGSPLDAAKAIAILIGYLSDILPVDGIKCDDKELADLLYDGSKKVNVVPVVAVPTTCGTGSEVTGVSVLTVHEKKTKASLPHRVFPKLALVDAKYLRGASKSVICNTAIDAMSHLVESYLVNVATPYSDMIVKEGLQTWGKIIVALEGKREFTDSDYENLMHAATLGGMSIAHTGTAIPHTMSYTLTYNYHIPHGVAVGYFLPGYMKLAGEKCGQLMDMMGFESVNAFASFFQKITGIKKLEWEKLAPIVESVSKNQAKLDLCCYELNYEKLAEIASWEYEV